MDALQLLQELSSYTGVSGDERCLSKILQKKLLDFAEDVRIDSSGNCIAVIQNEDGKLNLMLEAHLDEIGLVVTGFEKDGFLRVSNCGGIDANIMPAQEVIVHGKEDVFGVVCSIPPHLNQTGLREKSRTVNDLMIDCGLSMSELQTVVSRGDRISFRSNGSTLLNQRFTGKSLDNRAGVATILLALEKKRKKSLPCNLSVLFAVQEEVGTRGAAVGAYDIHADYCICIDVSFAKTQDIPDYKCGRLSKGAMIGISPVLSHSLTNLLIQAAKEQDIPYQLEVMGGTTSTDADPIATTREGVQTALCSIPLRYMHTPGEVVSTEDIELTSDLLSHFIESFQDGGYLNA